MSRWKQSRLLNRIHSQKKEAREKERVKFAGRMRAIKGEPVRWAVGVATLTVDGFKPASNESRRSGSGGISGVLKLYRESEPRVETKGEVFKGTIDHVIRSFVVGQDISPALYKKLTPTGKIVIEGNVFDVDIRYWSRENAAFGIVLVTESRVVNATVVNGRGV